MINFVKKKKKKSKQVYLKQNDTIKLPKTRSIINALVLCSEPFPGCFFVFGLFYPVLIYSFIIISRKVRRERARWQTTLIDTNVDRQMLQIII